MENKFEPEIIPHPGSEYKGIYEQLKIIPVGKTIFSLEVLTEAIKDFQKGKPPLDFIKEYVSPYTQLTKEEISNLKNGDTCYIESSYGMQKTTFPELSGDTHRNLFGKGGANKTLQEKINYGPIYKKMANKIDLLTDRQRMELIVLTKKGQERVELNPLLDLITAMDKRIEQLEAKLNVYGR